MTRKLVPYALCALVGLSAWTFAANTQREDADERVAAMLPPPERNAIWEPGDATQAFAFGGQAAIGAMLLWFGIVRQRGSGK